MIRHLTHNNRAYIVFTSNRSVMMNTANNVARKVSNKVTIAKVLAALAENDHAEALEINQGIDEALRALAVTIERLPEEADTGRHCGNTQEYIQKKFEVWIPYSMLADLIERAAHACN